MVWGGRLSHRPLRPQAAGRLLLTKPKARLRGEKSLAYDARIIDGAIRARKVDFLRIPP